MAGKLTWQELSMVEDLGIPISTLTADIDRFKTGIGESQVQMKRDEAHCRQPEHTCACQSTLFARAHA